MKLTLHIEGSDDVCKTLRNQLDYWCWQTIKEEGLAFEYEFPASKSRKPRGDRPRVHVPRA